MTVHYKTYVFLILFITLLTGCAEEKPIVDEETYMEILAELEIIYVVQSHTQKTELTEKLIDEVWLKYNVSNEDFLQSHAVYEKDVTEQLRRVNIIAEKLTVKYHELEAVLGQKRLEEPP